MTFPQFDLQGQVALVTGASRGIGYDVARALAHAGAQVIVAARDTDALSQLVERIHAEGGKATALELDVASLSSIQDGVAHVLEQFGKIDVLVNNAGLGFNHAAVEVTEQDWDEMMNVNLKGAFFMAQACGRVMLQHGYGRIINMSSQASVVGIADHVVYCTTKGGMNQMTKVLALEWGGQGVTVNAVAPTFIRTPGTSERLDRPEFIENVLAQIPVGQVGDTMDVAAAVIYLASPAGKLVNGHVLLVDGGWTAH